MGRLCKILLSVSLLLIVASFTTCHFGVEYEINKIPPEQRARMADFDWIGVEWIARGMGIFLLAILSLIAALTIELVERKRTASSDKEVRDDTNKYP
jgi:hypothetical protein